MSTKIGSVLHYARNFSKLNMISTRHCTQMKTNGIEIPEWIPRYEDLPEAPQYLNDFEDKLDSNENMNISHSSEMETEIAEVEHAHTASNIVTTGNRFDSCLILDELENNSIYPSDIKHKFVAGLKDVPSHVMTPIEYKTALTAHDAANWPVPPWHSQDFIEPRRDETQIVTKNMSKYPQMFAVDSDHIGHIATDDSIMSYEERVTELNIKQQKLMRQKEIKDYLTKRREPVRIQKLSFFHDDSFRVKVHIIAAICVILIYLKHRIAPRLHNKYGYQGKDIERNERLSKLPIAFRKEGDIIHEEDLSHLTTELK
eukprot:389858_1